MFTHYITNEQSIWIRLHGGIHFLSVDLLIYNSELRQRLVSLLQGLEERFLSGNVLRLTDWNYLHVHIIEKKCYTMLCNIQTT